jgi:hypothetical protein
MQPKKPLRLITNVHWPGLRRPGELHECGRDFMVVASCGRATNLPDLPSNWNGRFSGVHGQLNGNSGEQLIPGDVMCTPGDLAPTVSLGTIGKDDFRTTFLAHAGMPLGFRIITGISGNKCRSNEDFNAVAGTGRGITTSRWPANPSCFSRHFIFAGWMGIHPTQVASRRNLSSARGARFKWMVRSAEFIPRWLCKSLSEKSDGGVRPSRAQQCEHWQEFYFQMTTPLGIPFGTFVNVHGVSCLHCATSCYDDVQYGYLIKRFGYLLVAF